jgi:hypothetical protein
MLLDDSIQLLFTFVSSTLIDLIRMLFVISIFRSFASSFSNNSSFVVNDSSSKSFTRIIRTSIETIDERDTELIYHSTHFF